MLQSKNIGRRELLRSGGVAIGAVALAGTTLPAVAGSSPDAKPIELGNEAMAQAKATRRAKRELSRIADKRAATMAQMELPEEWLPDGTKNPAWWEAWEAAGNVHNRKALYREYCRQHTKLRRMVTALAKLRAQTVDGLASKAMVIAVSRDALDADWWCDKLQDSLIADLARNARVEAS